MTKNIIIGLLAVVAVVFAVLYFSVSNLLGANPGVTHWQSEAFLQGIYVGTGQQLSISNAGLLTTSGGLTNTGALTQSGNVQFSSSLSTTTIIVGKGSATAGYSPGCIVIGDTTTSSTLNYVTAVNGVLTATTTQPAACRK